MVCRFEVDTEAGFAYVEFDREDGTAPSETLVDIKDDPAAVEAIGQRILKLMIDGLELVTRASQVAEALGHDGTCWETEDGVPFLDLVTDADVVHQDDGNILYQFPDGSTLRELAWGAWDIPGH